MFVISSVFINNDGLLLTGGNSRKHKPVCATADIVPVLDVKDLFYDPLFTPFTKFDFSVIWHVEFGRPLEK